MSIFDNNDVKDLLNLLIRIGEVSDVNPAACTARVVFDDDDSVVSKELQILQKNTLSTKDYYMPVVGEDVVCLFLPTGIEEGFILGSVYAGEITPPETDGNKRTVVFADDTKVSYDSNTHQLSITIGETSFMADSSSLVVTSPTITFRGNVHIEGDTTTTGSITASGDVVGAGKSLPNHTHKDSVGGTTTAPL